MNFYRKLKRFLYGSVPGFKGSFPYWGEKIYFPPRSMIFDLACAQGIFEEANLKLLQAAVRPGSWYFDIGANIGLMSAPLLQSNPALSVVSVEASPKTVSFLARTIAGSNNRSRWHLVPKALGNSEGSVDFFTADVRHGAYDGMRDTHRAEVQKVAVPLSTLDSVWSGFGQPDVSVIKIDVEGAELDVLQGARRCIEDTKPIILSEWNLQNLKAYGRPPESLWDFANDLGYDIFNVPSLARMSSRRIFALQSAIDETFILVPRM